MNTELRQNCLFNYYRNVNMLNASISLEALTTLTALYNFGEDNTLNTMNFMLQWITHIHLPLI